MNKSICIQVYRIWKLNITTEQDQLCSTHIPWLYFSGIYLTYSWTGHHGHWKCQQGCKVPVSKSFHAFSLVINVMKCCGISTCLLCLSGSRNNSFHWNESWACINGWSVSVCSGCWTPKLTVHLIFREDFAEQNGVSESISTQRLKQGQIWKGVIITSCGSSVLVEKIDEHDGAKRTRSCTSSGLVFFLVLLHRDRRLVYVQ